MEKRLLIASLMGAVLFLMPYFNQQPGPSPRRRRLPSPDGPVAAAVQPAAAPQPPRPSQVSAGAEETLVVSTNSTGSFLQPRGGRAQLDSEDTRRRWNRWNW